MYIHGGLSIEFYFDRSVPRVCDRVCTEVLVVRDFRLWERRFGYHVLGIHRQIAFISVGSDSDVLLGHRIGRQVS